MTAEHSSNVVANNCRNIHHGLTVGGRTDTDRDSVRLKLCKKLMISQG